MVRGKRRSSISSRILTPSKGNIYFEGKEPTGLKPHSIARLGMIRTFQLVRILPGFTVTQNMIATSHLHPKIGLWEAVFNSPGYRKKREKTGWGPTEGGPKLMGLTEMKDTLAGNLPHGHRKLLGIAMALAAKPRLLLLDESLGGMNTSEVDNALGIIDKIRKQGIAILLIEHNVQAVVEHMRQVVCDQLRHQNLQGSSLVR